ncbi:Protein transport Sec1b [Diplonema papillatum]|nr:Protein transport Sec1b [Diplonema papillatum]
MVFDKPKCPKQGEQMMPPFLPITRVRASTSPRPAGLFQNLQDCLLTEIVPEDVPKIGAVLVVDEAALALLEKVVKVVDLARRGISLVDYLEYKREPMPSMPVVYFVSPTVDNATTIVEDWEAHSKMYATCHIFSTCEITDSCSFISLLKGSYNLRWALRSVKMLTYSFVCQSEFGYTIGKGEYMDYSPHLESFFSQSNSAAELRTTARATAESLIKVLECMGDRPVIRYQSGSGPAKVVGEEIYRMLKKESDPIDESIAGTLLILDRSVDPVTPFLHQFTYEAAVHDLRPMNDKIKVLEKYESVLEFELAVDGYPQGIEFVMDATNEYWSLLRNEHIDVLRRAVADDLRETVARSDASKIHPDLRPANFADISVEEFSAAIREMPNFQRKLNNLNVHMEVLLSLQKEMTVQRIVDFARVEQDLATQQVEDERGTVRKLDRKVAWRQLEAVLDIPPPQVDGFANGNGNHVNVGSNGDSDSLNGSIKDLSSSTNGRRNNILEADGNRTMYLNKLRAVLVFTCTEGELSEGELFIANKLMRKHHPKEPPVDLYHGGVLGLNGTLAEKERYKHQREMAKHHRFHLTPAETKKSSLSTTADSDAYLLSRAEPRLKSIIDELLTPMTLFQTSSFPACGPTTLAPDFSPLRTRSKNKLLASFVNSKKQSPSWVTDNAAVKRSLSELESLKGPRVHIFIIGGVSPAELRVVAEARTRTGRDIVVGGHSVLTPLQMLRSMPFLCVKKRQAGTTQCKRREVLQDYFAITSPRP